MFSKTEASNTVPLSQAGRQYGHILQDSKGSLYMNRHDGIRKLGSDSLYILRRGAEKASQQRKAIRALVYILAGAVVVFGLLLVWIK